MDNSISKSYKDFKCDVVLIISMRRNIGNMESNYWGDI